MTVPGDSDIVRRRTYILPGFLSSFFRQLLSGLTNGTQPYPATHGIIPGSYTQAA